MVYINIVKDNPIIADCHIDKENGEYFRLVIDPKTKELIEQPAITNVDVSTAYSHIFGYLLNNKPLPQKMISEWG